MRSRQRASVVTAALVVLASGLSLAGEGLSMASATPASYPSCGFYWNRNTPPSTGEQRANRCIVRASRDGRRARLVGVLTTLEGDPIVNYVFVRGPRDVLLVVDSTRDAFGARQWSRMRCTGLFVDAGRLGWRGCRQTGTGKPAWLKPVRLRG